MKQGLEVADLVALLVDFSRAVAKRYGLESVNDDVILVALYELRPSNFEVGQKKVWNAAKNALASNYSDAIVEDVETYLASFVFIGTRSIEQFWETANKLFAEKSVPSESTLETSARPATRNDLHVNNPLPGEYADPNDDKFLYWCANESGINFEHLTREVRADLSLMMQITGAHSADVDISKLTSENESFCAVFDELRSLQLNAHSHTVSRSLALSYLSFVENGLRNDSSLKPEALERSVDVFKLFLRRKLTPEAIQDQSTKEIFSKHFDSLYGLEKVKAELLRHVKSLIAQKIREKKGHAVDSMTMHASFEGSPGTGKTEVARRYGAVLKDLGVLRTGEFHEAGKADFVAKYTGQTETKTKKLIEKAKGGVLFIDEAYALNDKANEDEHKGYGEIAIETLVADLENLRRELLVIVAGYTYEMDSFFDVNPGLRSRIPTRIVFPDLSADELVQIGNMMLTQRGMKAQAGFTEKFRSAIESRMKNADFGNARGVRNLIDEAIRFQQERLSELGEFATKDELATLTEADAPISEPSGGTDGNHHIGYL